MRWEGDAAAVGTPVVITFDDGHGDETSVSAHVGMQTVVFPARQFVAPSSTVRETTVTLDVPRVEGEDQEPLELVVESIALYEIDRLDLSYDSTDLAVDTGTLSQSAPIREEANGSIPGVATLLDALDARRCGHFHLGIMSEAPAETSSTSFADLLEVPAHVLGAVRALGSTTQTLAVYVRLQVTGSSSHDGEIRITRRAGTVTVPFAGGTAEGWHVFGETFDAEDLATEDGRRAAAREFFRIEARVTNAALTLSISGLSLVVIPSTWPI